MVLARSSLSIVYNSEHISHKCWRVEDLQIFRSRCETEIKIQIIKNVSFKVCEKKVESSSHPLYL